MVIGVLFGLFGVAGSSFATPVLGVLGVPGLIAVAAPLPATIPTAIAGAAAYVLANGGGFLLVPLFVLVLGLTMPESAGTSLIVIAVLSVPTLATHWALGHIDWQVAAASAAGAVRGALAGSRLVTRLPAERLRKGFGVLLIGFAVYFTARQLLT